MKAVKIIEADWHEPIAVLSAFADEPWALGLLSGGGSEAARWSYVMRRPDRTLNVAGDARRDAFDALSALLGEAAPEMVGGPPFQGGVAGLCSYELGDQVERLGLARKPGWPDLACARYPAVLAFDHRDQVVLAIGRSANDGAAATAAKCALSWLTEARRPSPNGPLVAELTPEPPADYETAVAEVVGRICAGEIFQANIARSWSGRLTAGCRPFDLFARLALASPAPFAAYLRLADRAVVSNSPERFLRVSRSGESLHVETRPIKGTLPRGRDAAEDACMAATLRASLKDRAENLMIVDLMRNDLARVCSAGAVKAPELFRIESFANVHHLVSKVTGTLAPGQTAVDLLRAAFPPGSITGAPKVQAMKVIAGLEAPRGPFFGAMFWAGADGGMDSNVLIRTAAFEKDGEGWRVEARAGAGIVADSDPLAERRETEAKFAALAHGLTSSLRELDLAVPS